MLYNLFLTLYITFTAEWLWHLLLLDQFLQFKTGFIQFYLFMNKWVVYFIMKLLWKFHSFTNKKSLFLLKLFLLSAFKIYYLYTKHYISFFKSAKIIQLFEHICKLQYLKFEKKENNIQKTFSKTIFVNRKDIYTQEKIFI